MKSEKGITLVSLLVYIAILLTVMVVIGRISGMFSKNLDYVASENDTATAFTTLNACILTETKKNDNTVAKVGFMDGNNEQGYVFKEATSGNYTAIEFSSKNQICYMGNSVYYNKAKICEGVENFSINYYKAPTSETKDSLVVRMKIGNKNYEQSYSFR